MSILKTVSLFLCTLLFLTGVLNARGRAAAMQEEHQQESAVDVDADSYARRTLAAMNVKFSVEVFGECLGNGDTELVELFLDAGIVNKLKGREKEFILVVAVHANHADIVKLLLNRGVTVDEGIGELRRVAIGRGNITILKLLMDRGFDFKLNTEELAHLLSSNKPHVLKLFQDRGLINQDNTKMATRRINEQRAIEVMRLIHSVQATYQAGIGNGSFGSAYDLFYQDFIDCRVAAALGVTNTISLGGQECRGGNEPYYGYRLQLNYEPAAPGKLSRFKAVAIVAVPKGEERSGERNFFVDETGVIRASDDPAQPATAKSPPLNN